MASHTQTTTSTSSSIGAAVQQNAKKFKFILPPTFHDKKEERRYKVGKLAAAFRIFGQYGFDEGVAGHLTLRDPILRDHFWVNPFGRAFSQMTVSDLLLISPEGEIVMGGKPDRQVYNESAFAIHHAIHVARPDVEAACHSHSVYGRAFSTLGIDLDITTQDACAFHNDLALYEGFGGVVLAAEEGQNIASSSYGLFEPNDQTCLMYFVACNCLDRCTWSKKSDHFAKREAAGDFRGCFTNWQPEHDKNQATQKDILNLKPQEKSLINSLSGAHHIGQPISGPETCKPPSPPRHFHADEQTMSSTRPQPPTARRD